MGSLHCEFAGYALQLARYQCRMTRCPSLSLSLSLDIGYRLRAPGRLEARRILQAGSALPVVINYAGTLNSIHGIVMYLNRCVPIPIDPRKPIPP